MLFCNEACCPLFFVHHELINSTTIAVAKFFVSAGLWSERENDVDVTPRETRNFDL